MDTLDLELKIELLEQRIAALESKKRDRGPKSENSMTDELAWVIMFGQYKGVSHKKTAQELGLSYGQVYSARGQYTFTHITEDSFDEVTIAE